MLVPLPLVVLLLAAAASTPAPAAGDGGAGTALPVISPIISLHCNSTSVRRTYQPGSAFAANLADLSRALPRNASASGFSAGAFGGGAPGTVYGLVLCRGDYTGSRCASCLEAGFRYAELNCFSSSDVAVYYDQCQLRYSDQDFLAGVRNAPESAAQNMNNVFDANVAAFDALVARLVAAVADKASNVSRRYATGRAGFPPQKMNVYALAQCTPDLTTAQCRGCLAGIIREMPALFTGKIGGRVLGVRCDIRYEDNAFMMTDADIVELTPLVNSSKG